MLSQNIEKNCLLVSLLALDIRSGYKYMMYIVNIPIEKLESATGAQGLGKRKWGQVKALRYIFTMSH
jgi:hypothetical protein